MSDRESSASLEPLDRDGIERMRASIKLSALNDYYKLAADSLCDMAIASLVRSETGKPLQAHSKTEYKRMAAQGANVLPPEDQRAAAADSLDNKAESPSSCPEQTAAHQTAEPQGGEAVAESQAPCDGDAGVAPRQPAALSALQADRETVVRECAAVCDKINAEHGEHPEMALTCKTAILKLLEPK